MMDTKRLDELSEDIAEEFFEAATPANWTGAGQEVNKMTPEVRGARNWDVKNANQIGALLVRVLDLKERIYSPNGPADDEAEAELARYEKQGKELLARVKNKNAA